MRTCLTPTHAIKGGINFEISNIFGWKAFVIGCLGLGILPSPGFEDAGDAAQVFGKTERIQVPGFFGDL